MASQDPLKEKERKEKIFSLQNWQIGINFTAEILLTKVQNNAVWQMTIILLQFISHTSYGFYKYCTNYMHHQRHSLLITINVISSLSLTSKL